ncbi:MAG: metallophosphoesterase family protein [Planctomycetota bacterium]
MIAFLSDLHANLEALEVALQDLEQQGVETVVCLGDVIGYGASPREVIELVRTRFDICLQGNHDAALLDDQDAFGFNERALAAIDWTRRALDPEKEENWPLWDWLGSLVPAMELAVPGEEAVQIVHASPREPLTEYLMPNLAADGDRVLANFEAAEHRLTFFGHTHHPGFFVEGEPYRRAVDLDNKVELDPSRRYLINVGSVGQPRDGDPRLAYALFDGGSVQWRRLEYPSADAGRRIQDAGLPESLAARLIVGR